MSGFSYPPLPGVNALRILTLKPGEFFDPLEGDLVPTTLAAKPRYVTLSYTWDDPISDQPDIPVSFTRRPPGQVEGEEEDPELKECQRDATLALNGHDVPIRRNLALALRYVRSASHPLPLWVDAVCINQADIEERNSQVAFMAMIYSRSLAVVTWLGLNGAEVVGALQTFDQDGGMEAAKAMRDVYNMGNSKNLASWFAEQLAAQSRAGAGRTPGSRAIAEKEALEHLAAGNQLGDSMAMETRYWERIWVVQEICLTKRVFFLYGPTLLVNEGSVKYMHQTKDLKASKGMDNMLRARGRRFGESMRLEILIEDFADQQCTDTRDKVYGLVGLANDVNAVQEIVSTDNRYGEDIDFIIDYRRSFYEIWCDAVHYRFLSPYYLAPPNLKADQDEIENLRHDQLTKLVRFAALVQTTLLGEVENHRLQEDVWSREDTSMCSAIRAQMLGPMLFGQFILPARGYLAGKIVDIGPTYAEFVESSRCQATWRARWRKHYPMERELEKLREIEEEYASNILEYGEADVARIARVVGHELMAFSSPVPGRIDEMIATRSSRACVGQWSRFSSEMLKQPIPSCDGGVTRFLATDQCMGLAPPGATVGDWVVRFWNCDAAIIVRPVNADDPKSLCRLIGRADVADFYRRKDGFDRVANQTLYPLKNRGEKYIDMVMTWRTLQSITSSVST